MLARKPALGQGRIFYGWYIVAIATVGSFLAGGLTSQVFAGLVSPFNMAALGAGP